ncbi:heme o synthase [Paenibacillus ginsengarvi]|uniref:Protoheme IX farnesyltransferase n=1 Tax=Paenibacillus ginsengarvi TaxID=400777 RepID=A0A3B0C8K8_9BACL|nr:heme o synthase [Paenibacillus ginsengarvi]RKN80738.1 protoheme IX farnesyltransferase [Paenibacillus ginsengarvi]
MDKQLSIDAVAAAEAQEAPAVIRKPNARDFIQLAKPGILFSNIITAFGGYWVAWGNSGESFNLPLMLYAMLGTLLVMASGCVLNNYLDRDLDTKMTRTRKRALPTGVVSPKIVFWYGIILGAAGLSVLSLLVNPLSGLLGVVGLLVYVLVYTAWLKRTSTLSTTIGAISGAMPPVIGYCAVTGHLDMGAWILFGILFFWQPPHFWALGIRRKEEYRAAGFPLLPVVHGNELTKMHMLRFLVMLVPVSLLLYAYGYVGEIYLFAAIALGLAWTFIGLAGFKTKDDDNWAKRMFVFSINYLPLLFIVMIIDTIRG